MAHTYAWHLHHNATHYPGTRQMCIECDEPTERCEEDSFDVDGHGPLCRECYYKAIPTLEE